MYSTPACPYCRMAKEYLAEKGIRFREIDVAGDPKSARQMIELSGQIGVPQIVIGETVIVGFDRAELDKAIGI